MEDRLRLLEEIYRLFDERLKDFPTVCSPGCSTCCTDRVFMSTVEGYHVARYLRVTGKEPLYRRLEDTVQTQRHRPSVTTNQLAALCMQGREIPPQGPESVPTGCPFLSEDTCPIYPVRPLACRAVLSSRKCAPGGFALMDPFAVTLNDVFCQWIEHVDRPGWFGNMADVLLWTRDGPTAEPPPSALLRNMPIPALAVPPEHRRRMEPVLGRLLRLGNTRKGQAPLEGNTRRG